MTATKRIPGLNIVGTIVPCDERDTYATHDSQYGKGGWHEVATLAERDAIPEERRRIGMVVFVKEDYTNYQLKQTLLNEGWVAFATPDQDGTLTEAIKQMEKRVDILNEKVLDVEENFDQKADIYFVNKQVSEINAVIETLETKEDAAKHATKEELAEYLKKSEAEENYATKTELDLKADKSVLSAYATKVELDTYVSDVEIQAYAKKVELKEYAKTTEVETKLEGYATKAELEVFTTEDEVKAIVDEYIDPDELSGVLSNYVKVETLTANLANYPTKVEVEKTIENLNVEQYIDKVELQEALDGLDLDKYVDETELNVAITNLNLDQYVTETELQKTVDNIVYPLEIKSIEGGDIYEVGSSVDVTITWSYNKDITEQQLNGLKINKDIRSFTFNNVTEDTTYTLLATDNIRDLMAKTSVKFAPSCYWGASANETLTNEEILALNSEISETREQFRLVDCSGGKYFYFVIRQDLCENIIFKVNGIMFNSLEEEIIDLTNASGNTDKYILYRSTDMQTGTKIPVEVI